MFFLSSAVDARHQRLFVTAVIKLLLFPIESLLVLHRFVQVMRWFRHFLQYLSFLLLFLILRIILPVALRLQEQQHRLLMMYCFGFLLFPNRCLSYPNWL